MKTFTIEPMPGNRFLVREQSPYKTKIHNCNGYGFRSEQRAQRFINNQQLPNKTDFELAESFLAIKRRQLQVTTSGGQKLLRRPSNNFDSER